MGKERIAYIDFMKGLCILLIVMEHMPNANFYDSLLPHLDNTLKSFRIPMYFFLSGLFFKTYNGFNDFLRKKTNNLIITLLFFHFLCCFFKFPLVAIVHKVRPDVIIDFRIIDIIPPFLGRFWRAAGALWFLVALFLVNILYYIFHTFWGKRGVVIAVFISSILGYSLMKFKIVLPFEGDIALVGLPYFLLGSFIKQNNFLAPSKYDKLGYFVFLPICIFLYHYSSNISFLYQVVPNFFLLYFIPFIAILSLFWLCKNLRYIPLICYFGRYSVIILGTHQLLISYVFFLIRGIYPLVGITQSIIIFTIVMFIEFFIIKFMIKYFPRFTAQEEFFKPGWKMK